MDLNPNLPILSVIVSHERRIPFTTTLNKELTNLSQNNNICSINYSVINYSNANSLVLYSALIIFQPKK